MADLQAGANGGIRDRHEAIEERFVSPTNSAKRPVEYDSNLSKLTLLQKGSGASLG